jgi:hypothetical protein
MVRKILGNNSNLNKWRIIMARYLSGESGNKRGRPKGSTTTIMRIKVAEVLRKMDFNPFIEAVNLFRETKSDKVKATLIVELCSYIAPKLKQIEMLSENENPFIISLNIAPKNNVPVNVIDGKLEDKSKI